MTAEALKVFPERSGPQHLEFHELGIQTQSFLFDGFHSTSTLSVKFQSYPLFVNSSEAEVVSADLWYTFNIFIIQEAKNHHTKSSQRPPQEWVSPGS